MRVRVSNDDDNLGDPLRGRAFRCRSPLMQLRWSAAIPVACRSLALAARSACRRARHAVPKFPTRCRTLASLSSRSALRAALRRCNPCRLRSRAARCALRLPGGSLRSPPRAGPPPPAQRSTASSRPPPRSPRDGAPRRARPLPVVSAPPAAHSPRRLRSVARTAVRFSMLPSPSACPFVRPAALLAHTRRIVDAGLARLPMSRLRCPRS